MYKKAELVFGGAAIAFAMQFFWLARKFPGARLPDVGMAFYPRILSVFIVFLSVIMVVQSIRRKKVVPQEQAPLFATEDYGVWRVLVLLVATTIYPFLLRILGFLILTPLYLILLLVAIRAGGTKRILALSLLTTAIIYVVFQRMLKIPLPTGLFYY